MQSGSGVFIRSGGKAGRVDAGDRAPRIKHRPTGNIHHRGDTYRWRMNGSYSLKSVLPVLVPEMTYDGMEISESHLVHKKVPVFRSRPERPVMSAQLEDGIVRYL